MAMVNMNNLLNGKDSRWLQLEVCREFQRQKCTRPDTECKFAHPPANVEVQNGRVTACYDSIKVCFYYLFYLLLDLVNTVIALALRLGADACTDTIELLGLTVLADSVEASRKGA